MGKKKDSLFWKISHPGKRGHSYVFGTMHVRNDTFFHVLETVKPAIASSELFLSEVDISDLKTLDSKFIMSGQSLESTMSKSKYRKIRKRFKILTGTNLRTMDFYYPLFIQNLLTETIFKKNTLTSMDEVLWEYATENDIRKDGIETIQEQLNVFEKIPYKDQQKSLVIAIQKQAAFRAQMKQLESSYRAMDIQKLYKSVRRGLGKMRKVLLDNRNVEMAERIYTLTGDYSLFCAVGAAHLGGSKGILRLLKQNGMRIRPEYGINNGDIIK